MQPESRGRALAHAYIAGLSASAQAVRERLGRNATLAIVAGSDDAARRFVDIKRQMLAELPLTIVTGWLADDATTAAASAAVEALNDDDAVDAIFLQFPLPAAVDAQRVADEVAIEKDIDCSGTVAESLFLAGQSRFTPVAPRAALDLLHDALGSLVGKRVVVDGDDPFARALRVLLARESVRLEGSREAVDALVVVERIPADVTGQIGVLLDAGYYLPPRPTDWLPAGLRSRVGVWLGQYGNVGPLTVAHLAEATLTLRG